MGYLGQNGNKKKIGRGHQDEEEGGSKKKNKRDRTFFLTTRTLYIIQNGGELLAWRSLSQPRRTKQLFDIFCRSRITFQLE